MLLKSLSGEKKKETPGGEEGALDNFVLEAKATIEVMFQREKNLYEHYSGDIVSPRDDERFPDISSSVTL